MRFWASRLLPFLVACWTLGAGLANAGYAMYVWKDGFDATVPGCGEAELLAWDKVADDECYTHNWESAESRQWLWDTANRPGRGISRLFISDVKNRLQFAFETNDCSTTGIDEIKQMLNEGHCKVPDVKIHALLSTSDIAVSEQSHPAGGAVHIFRGGGLSW